MKPFNKSTYEEAVLGDYATRLNDQRKVAAVWKANAERNTKIEAEKSRSLTMDIYAKLGTSIRYLGVNGYDSDREYANKYLSVDSIYTVKRTEVGNWSSSVELLEFPDKLFNTVLFSEVL